ncbi:hypothetical protein CEXT_126891 [Caerostris extrusa]|uniref:Uncharacterized protein n=1 Tax=Caerostris extrusa TaxID=172846 RepID=A0AAV4V9F3_CAEEX|nr:hypothetical protein CEXT_126891 [Caerostris extrusa]
MTIKEKCWATKFDRANFCVMIFVLMSNRVQLKLESLNFRSIFTLDCPRELRRRDGVGCSHSPSAIAFGHKSPRESQDERHRQILNGIFEWLEIMDEWTLEEKKEEESGLY